MFEDGFPVKFYENGNIKYKGNFKNGKRYGKGKEYYVVPNPFLKSGYSCINKRFEGYFENDKYEGEGILYYDNGKCNIKKYKGNFIKGKFEGKGILYYENDRIYENGRICKMKVSYPLRDCERIKYKGEFVNGEYNGAGEKFRRR
jgi:hypothetical protein